MSTKMRVGIAALAVAFVASFSLVALSAQGDDKKPAEINDKCPVSGRDIDKTANSTITIGMC